MKVGETLGRDETLRVDEIQVAKEAEAVVAENLWLAHDVHINMMLVFSSTPQHW